MLEWLFLCCTPGIRKQGSGPPIEGRPTVPSPSPVTTHRYGSMRSLTTNDLPETLPSARKTSGGIGLPSPRASMILSGSQSWRPEVSVLTYNIFIRPDLPLSTSTEYQDIRLEMFADNVLPHHDIVCLQELFHIPMSSRRRVLIDRAKSIGYFWHHHSSRNNALSPTIDGGLLILSKLPIVRTDFLNFSVAAFADWYATKGVLYCLVQCGPSPRHFMHVFCTHLQATYNKETKDVSERVRYDQVAQMTTFIDKCVRSNSHGNLWPIVLCGDLNVQCRRSALDG